METLWRSGGWDGEAAVTRNEARMRRSAIRELAYGLRAHLATGTPPTAIDDLDNPWTMLRHLTPIFGAVVGAPDDACPDAVNAAWIRRVVPNTDEPNRSRWDTDPAWRIVQAAPFDQPVPAPVRRLVRRKQRAQNVAKLDSQAFGVLVSRTAELHPNGGHYDISKAVAEAYVALEAESRRPGKDFGELVRQRRKERGLPVSITEKVLPLRANGSTSQPSLTTLDVAQREATGHPNADPAACGPAQALYALAEGERQGLPSRELDDREAVFRRELSKYEAIVASTAVVLANDPLRQSRDGGCDSGRAFDF